jgi:hypothetical protein
VNFNPFFTSLEICQIPSEWELCQDGINTTVTATEFLEILDADIRGRGPALQLI